MQPVFVDFAGQLTFCRIACATC